MRTFGALVLLAELLVGWGGIAAPVGTQLASGEIEAATAAAVRNSCRKDYQARCNGTRPALAFEIACLNQYYVNLSAGCRAALQNLKSAQSGEQRLPDEGER